MKDDFKKGEAAFLHQDYSAAFAILKPLAEANITKAQNLLGLMYEMGFGVKRDIDVAIKWLERSANLGEAAAAHNLGSIYMGGGEPDIPQNK